MSFWRPLLKVGRGDDRGGIDLSRGSLMKLKVPLLLMTVGGCRGCGLSKLSQGGVRACCLCFHVEPPCLHILSLDF